MNLNILIMGGGGREHAIAWKIAKSLSVKNVYVSPGNPGMENNEKIKVVLKNLNFDETYEFILNNSIDLVIIGPEKPLTKGIVDYLENKKVLVLGPSKAAAMLESSKIFSKEFMNATNIPTAEYKSFTNSKEALEELSSWDVTNEGIVIKANELAAGKGVIVTSDMETAKKAVVDFLDNKECSVNSEKILFEKKLTGKEFSAFALCDGENFIPMGYACDYKRIHDDDKGPNTGGMGGYTPNDELLNKYRKKIETEIFPAVLKGMKKKGTPFKGHLFVGLMINSDEINVLEFNVRLGDPEAQILLPVIEEDLVPYFMAAAKGLLKNFAPLKSSNKINNSVHVVLTSNGYPSIHQKPMLLDQLISVDKRINNIKDTIVFYSAVKKEGENFLNNGGRVLGITCTDKLLDNARTNVYEAIKYIHFNKAHWRNDIAKI